MRDKFISILIWVIVWMLFIFLYNTIFSTWWNTDWPNLESKGNRPDISNMTDEQKAEMQERRSNQN